MSDENKKKFNIIINEQDEKVDLGKNFSSQYRLTLYDKDGEEIKQASKVNNETTAVLQVFIKNNVGNQEVDRGIRVDIYICPNNSEIVSGQKSIRGIANEQLYIDLI